MASNLEASPGGLSASPTSSGRASPVPRWSQFGTEKPHSKDKAYRRYASGVERSLSLFDTALQEWADYISFLGRLLKSLQARPATVTDVPSKAIVAKRLAQCLNPALPSGVHQKAIEVYSFIFSMIGKDALSRDLPIYLPGLSSTLSFASLSVRTPFLDLLETYIVHLDIYALRPAFKAIILTLLPGLEEETSEEFDRTLKLLDAFKAAIRPPKNEDLGQNHRSGDEFFWQCFFLAAITSHGRRLGALAYLVRSLPRLGQPYSAGGAIDSVQKDELDPYSHRLADIVTTPEPGLLLRCFAAGLADEQILIQRGFQDLLVTHLPLHSDVLQKRVKTEDLEFLVTAAAGVVVRREMSLNRRLWTWLLGPEPASTEHDNGPESPHSSSTDHLGNHLSRTRYFEEFGMQSLTSSLLKLISGDTVNPVERARPFRICLSLMDRWEIGGLVVPDIFLPIISSVRKYKDIAANKADFSEVLRSASVFFDGVESGLIWGEIIGLIAQAIGAGKLSVSERIDKLSIVTFIITHFNVREEEMLLIHAPLATLTILTMLEDAKGKGQKQPGDQSPAEDVSNAAINIAMDLIELVPERAFQTRPSTNQSTATTTVGEGTLRASSNIEIIQSIKKFYVEDQGNLDACPPPFSSRDVSELLVREAGRITWKSFSGPLSSADVGIKTKLLVVMLSKVPKVGSLDVREILSSVHSRMGEPSRLPFLALTSITTLVNALYSTNYISTTDISGLVDPLVRLAWSYLGASHPKYHVEAVRCLWQLQTALSLSNREIEASICSLMVEHDLNGTFAVQGADHGRSFSILWTHTLQDNAGQFDRKSSKTSYTETKNPARAPGLGNYEIMLGRPIFLMLDALLDERTQLFMTVRTWLQGLVGIDKLFHLFVAKFSSFDFLQHVDEDKAPSLPKNIYVYAEDDDLDQCLYYLRTFSNMLRWSSENIWIALAENSISTDKSYPAVFRITGRDGEIPLLEFFVHVCLKAISSRYDINNSSLEPRISQLHRMALTTLHQILRSSYALPLAELELEHMLIRRLTQSLDDPDPLVQGLLLDVVFDSLNLRSVSRPVPQPLSPGFEHKRSIAQEAPTAQRPSMQTDRGDRHQATYSPPLPASLIQSLQAGIAAQSSRPILDSWIGFLIECLPLYSDSIFQIIIPLVETFCFQIEQTFDCLRQTFNKSGDAAVGFATPESTLLSLLNGLEHVLARGHDRLLQDELRTPVVKTSEQPQGFFGNMVSGVFASETPQARSATANNRLTVLLSFQDAVRICFKIWSWGGRGSPPPDAESVASFNYTSLRMRNRARRLLEHLFAAEALECLETVVEVWQNSSQSRQNTSETPIVFNLLHVLDGSRPKHTIPAIFNAIYSRTNPSALDPSRKSTLTSSLNDYDLVVFLVEYAKSLEDDAMDEIWADCMIFLKDLLTNPFPHRQTLPSLLEFAAILGEKVDNTNFGEQRRMRRELGDLFLRLLTAIFTTRPMGFLDNLGSGGDDANSSSRADDVVGILASIAPNLPKILVEPDRVLLAANTISTSVIGPTFKSKSFPDNVSKSTLVLLYQLSRLPNTQKSWKKDLGDAFNDPRFFCSTILLVESEWMPLLRQWCLSDKERVPELLSRLLPPTTAGIVFGVGATSARLEADRKTQLNLRRIATLILAAIDDNFVTDLPAMLEKVVELLGATTTSSPSSTTRADIYLLIRALVLKTSPVHLAMLWPIINAELQAAISSVVAADHSAAADTYNNHSTLQACKLLDTLICVAPDDFQLHEWLFITDNVDAVYRPSNSHPTGLIDEVSKELGSTAVSHFESSSNTAHVSNAPNQSRKLLIGPGGISDEGAWERKDELVGKVLRPFFSQLSIFAFESTYSMGMPDFEACKRGLLRDLFDDGSIVKAM